MCCAPFYSRPPPCGVCCDWTRQGVRLSWYRSSTHKSRRLKPATCRKPHAPCCFCSAFELRAAVLSSCAAAETAAEGARGWGAAAAGCMSSSCAHTLLPLCPHCCPWVLMVCHCCFLLLLCLCRGSCERFPTSQTMVEIGCSPPNPEPAGTVTTQTGNSLPTRLSFSRNNILNGWAGEL
jgi:hypothetical protein